jgi:hypothetical protein
MAVVGLDGLCELETFNNLIGIKTWDLPSGSVAPRSTTVRLANML